MRRSHINELEGLASIWVGERERALTRARRGADFRYMIGKNEIQLNLDTCRRQMVGIDALNSLHRPLRHFHNRKSFILPTRRVALARSRVASTAGAS